ncbi:MAG: HD domain-containing protein [Mollicutes bacterium]|nr:MAG: HD domain-containing protein [Mollicutes bacterium]
MLWHTLTMLKMANKVIDIYDYVKINKSLLYAGIMLHDIGKIYEINADLPEQYSFKGKLLGHISIGSEISKKYGQKLKLPEKKIDLLQHMILASHGKLENGSPIRPMLMESFILSQMDDFDSKTNAI